MAAEGSNGWRWEAVLFGVAAFLLLAPLHTPLQEPEEARYAEIPRQMLAHGSWLVPVLHGQAYYDKPPLLYWLVMSAYRVLGVHDWAARLVASLIGLLCVVVTYGWGRFTLGRVEALAGACVLCLSARFLYLAHLLTMNGLLCLCVIAALAAAHAAISSEALRWRWWLASAFAGGLGILAKGPVALVLVLAPLALFALWSGVRIGMKAWGAYVALALTIPAPWFIVVAMRDSTFVEYFFWKHHVERFVTPFDHVKPVWYYVPEVLLGMLPAFLLLPWMIRSDWRRRGAVGATHFYLLAALFAFVFFSVSGSKRAGYILPVMPPLALALGSYATTLPFRRTMVAAAAGMFLVLAVADVWLLPWQATRFALREEVQAIGVDDAPIFCYPHRWDSVSFYLRREDVRTFAARDEFLSILKSQPRSVVIIKNEGALNKLVEALPEALEFVPLARGRLVTAGWVVRRSAAP
jgi:dolichol-phosphate mannosyltransferase